MTTWITICDTCRHTDRQPGATDETDGQLLAVLLESHVARTAPKGVKTRRHSCLMGCTHGCNVAIQGRNKLVYTLGRFKPSQEAAAAITRYAELHAASQSGQVLYRQWPEGIKGHFVTRHPPLPE